MKEKHTEKEMEVRVGKQLVGGVVERNMLNDGPCVLTE